MCETQLGACFFTSDNNGNLENARSTCWDFILGLCLQSAGLVELLKIGRLALPRSSSAPFSALLRLSPLRLKMGVVSEFDFSLSLVAEITRLGEKVTLDSPDGQITNTDPNTDTKKVQIHI